RPQLAKVEGANLFLQPAQDISVGTRITRGSFQYTLQDTNIAELNEWSQKLTDKLRTLLELADVTSDLLANAPRLQITINRDQASRFAFHRKRSTRRSTTPSASARSRSILLSSRPITWSSKFCPSCRKICRPSTVFM